MRIYLPVSNKGGVGKTFLGFSLAYCFDRHKKTYGVIDFDTGNSRFDLAHNKNTVWLEGSDNIGNLYKASDLIRELAQNKVENLIFNFPGNYLDSIDSQFLPATGGGLIGTSGHQIKLIYIPILGEPIDIVKSWWTKVNDDLLKSIPDSQVNLFLAYFEHLWGRNRVHNELENSLNKGKIRYRSLRIPIMNPNLVADLYQTGKSFNELLNTPIEYTSSKSNLIKATLCFYLPKLEDSLGGLWQ